MIVKVLDIDMSPDKFEKINDSWTGQRKYNGVRCIACKSAGKVKLFSRHLKQYSMPHIEAALQNMPDDIMIDGELFKFGLPLQTLVGIVRAAENKYKDDLWYQVFDLYDLKNKDAPFIDRYDKIKQIINNLPSKKYIKLSPNIKIGKFTDYREFERAMNKVYRDFLSEHYEGIILRADHAPYEPGIHGKRSDFVYKHKPLLTKEFKIIGFTDGAGKEKNAIIWICETKHGEKFNVRPKWPYEERIKIYNDIKNNESLFNKKYKHKMLTVEYESLSIDDVPLQPRAIAIRIYE